MDILTRDHIIGWFQSLQDEICSELEVLDGGATFHEDLWDREEGGGGRTRIIQGEGIEKGGVNFSAVHGSMPENIARGLGLQPNRFLATGVSIVLHPGHPMVPIIHMNIRYFETDKGEWWFGGGIDLTPHIIYESDVLEFHKGLKSVCDDFSLTAYSEFKEWADNYFFITHRDETRGVGGIFFDRLNTSYGVSKKEAWEFVKSVGKSFVPLYSSIYNRRVKSEYTDEHKNWQMIRRGRYVEFNLVYDRGTKFGLETNGRIESILMSLPPKVQYHYNYLAALDFEAKTQSCLKKGIDWVNYKIA
jgi:coproporphyrinogen III oxidase